MTSAQRHAVQGVDCFISYSSQDSEFARAVAHDLASHGIGVFLAELSLEPGARWSSAIRAVLAKSDWVVFLASKAARESPSVQQELGMAMSAGKPIVPIVRDCSPEQLPGWTKEYQAIDLRGLRTIDEIRAQIARIADSIKLRKKERRNAAVVLSVIAGVALLFGGGKDHDDY